MKSTLLLAAFLTLMIPVVANAQNCKSVKETKDAFTNESVKKASFVIGDYHLGWSVNLEKRDEQYYLGIDVYQIGDIQYTFPKGDKVTLKLANGKFVELENPKDITPVRETGGTLVTRWAVNAKVEPVVYKRLSRSPITDIKVTIQEKDVVFSTIKEKQASRIVDAAACILGESIETK